MSKGGFKAFRGSAATAESYLLERDAERLDDYYREGQERAVERGVVTAHGVELGELSAEKFREWMEHRDPETGAVRGIFRTRRYVDAEGVERVGGTPLYQETIISVDKTLSLAAAGNPRVAAALNAAMSRACVEAAETLKEHAVTRVGDIGQQRQVKFDQLEFTSVQHTTSRAGDPHYHRHMQILPLGYAEGKWRALDGRTLYRLGERVNAAADRSISTDAEFRRVLAEEGLTWEPGQGGGRIAEYAHLVDKHSTRRDQVAANREQLEQEWRMQNPGQEPGRRQLMAWDTYAWAQDRPTKEPDRTLTPEGMAERVGAVESQNVGRVLYGQTAAQLDPETLAQSALSDLARSRSAWSAADVHAAIDRCLADTYLLGNEGVAQLRTATVAHAMGHSVSFFDDGVNVEGVRHYTSDHVLAVDERLTDALTMRALIPGENGTVQAERDGFALSQEQQIAAEAIAGTHQLVVIQGAAGAGKTTMLRAAADAVASRGRRLVVVSPTKRGALEAGDVLGTEGESVHALLYRAGAYVDDEGRWVLPEQWRPQPDAWQMDERTVLVVDEAGMLDQDTAAALHDYIDAQRVGTMVLSGDAAQLAAVGRGGYLARASSLAGVSFDLTDVRRFRTPDGSIDEAYADLSLRMRDREDPDAIFAELVARGLVRVGTLEEQLERVAGTVVLEEEHGRTSVVIAPTNAAAQRINHAVFERLADSHSIDTSTIVYGRESDPIAAGVRVATRENDRELGVANRQTWTVQNVNADGRITVVGESGHYRTLDAEYVAENMQLAYAVTGHGAQGMTVDTAHTLLSDELTAAGAYVGLTRGRHGNVLHVVGYDLADAQTQFVDALNRSDADLGLEAAREQAHRDIAGLDVGDRSRITEETDRLRTAAELHEQAAEEAAANALHLEQRITAYTERAETLAQRHEVADRTHTARVAAAVESAAEWEAYAAQLEAEGTQHAMVAGRGVLDARYRADAAVAQARVAGVFTRRSAEREATTALTQWQNERDQVVEAWGSAPHSDGELTAWAQQVAKQYPPAAEARTTLEQARRYQERAEQEHRELQREQMQERRELQRDVLGVRENQIGGTMPLDERTVTQWVRQHRENAEQHHVLARHDREEADTLDQLPTAEAEQRIEARRPAPREAAAEQTRTEQVLAEMWARQEQEREQNHERDIGW